MLLSPITSVDVNISLTNTFLWYKVVTNIRFCTDPRDRFGRFLHPYSSPKANAVKLMTGAVFRSSKTSMPSGQSGLSHIAEYHIDSLFFGLHRWVDLKYDGCSLIMGRE